MDGGLGVVYKTMIKREKTGRVPLSHPFSIHHFVESVCKLNIWGSVAVGGKDKCGFYNFNWWGFSYKIGGRRKRRKTEAQRKQKAKEKQTSETKSWLETKDLIEFIAVIPSLIVDLTFVCHVSNRKRWPIQPCPQGHLTAILYFCDVSSRAINLNVLTPSSVLFTHRGKMTWIQR